MTFSFLPSIRYTILCATLLCATQITAQQIGSWTDYLPYRSSSFVAKAGNTVYASTPFSVLEYDIDDNSIERLSTINALSDFGVSALGYDPITNTVIVGYQNGNIDLLQGNRVTNMADIKRSNLLTSKRINRVKIIDNTIYLACGFGIVVLDIEQQLVKDTWFIGDGGAFLNVNDLASDGTMLYAATSDGVYHANLSSGNLSNFSSWSKYPVQDNVSEISQVVSFADQVFAVFDSRVFSSDTLFELINEEWVISSRIQNEDLNHFLINGETMAIAHSNYINEYDQSLQVQNTIFTYGDEKLAPTPRALFLEEDTYWVADDRLGLVETPRQNQWGSSVHLAQGPRTSNVLSMDITEDELWVAPGSRTNRWSNLFNPDGVFSYKDGTWDFISQENDPLMGSIRDIVAVAIDPNKEGRIWGASIGSGLVQFQDGQAVTVWDETNSIIDLAVSSFEGFKAVTDVEFDEAGNLWIVNSERSDFLVVYTPEGEWYDFDLSSLNIGTPVVGHVLITSANHKWCLPKSGEQGIIVFDDNGTFDNLADDRSRLLTQSTGNGGLPSNEVFAIVEDLDNEIWVGTDEGIAVFFAPESIFEAGTNTDAQQILVTQDGFTGFLLETETILSMAVDGADRKWVGTDGSGVFLLSADGTEQLQHFTTENSPIFSNTINDIVIDPGTGEVFFGTDAGIISYQGDATSADFEFGEVLTFPNPVASGYEGPIAIRGLARNSVVKITDISGNLVFETIANGGQAIWDGKDFTGRRPNTGVYLVFAAKQDGLDSVVAKILFTN